MIYKSAVCVPVFALTLLAAASSSFAACTYPPPLGKLPDGATATMDEMKASNAQVKRTEADLDAYIKCIDEDTPPVQDATKLNDAQKKGQEASEQLRAERHNAAVADEEAIRDKWHEVLQAYKSKHPS